MVHADHHSREVGRGEPGEDDWPGTGGGGPGEDDDDDEEEQQRDQDRPPGKVTLASRSAEIRDVMHHCQHLSEDENRYPHTIQPNKT